MIENFCVPNQHNPSGACPIVEKNRFLKRVCAELEGFKDPTTILQCTHSEAQYLSFNYAETKLFSSVCDNDPHFYQRCGVGNERLLEFTSAMCGDYICDPVDTVHSIESSSHVLHPDVACGRKPCGNNCSPCKNFPESNAFCSVDEKSDSVAKVKLRSGLSVSNSTVCNGRCDAHYDCEDEAWCDGYLYGMYCTERRTVNEIVYVKPAEICDQVRYHKCRNNVDEKHCPELHLLPNNERCLSSKYGSWTMEVVILNSTKCGPPWVAGTNSYDPLKWRPRCINSQDQTNCTDPNR